MTKEIEPIQKLEQERTRLSNIIGQRESLVDNIGTDKVWIGSSSEGTLDKALVGSSFEATLKVGQARKNTRDYVVRLNGRLEGVNNQIHEFHAEEDAREHIAELNLRRNQLATMSEMVAEGNLTEDDLRKHQQDFEELQKRPDNNPLLQRAIERIRQEEEEKKKEGATEATKPAETKPLIEILPDGKVRLPNGKEVSRKRAQLLILLKDTSENNRKTSDELAKELHPGIEDKAARLRVTVRARGVKERTDGTGLELVIITPTPAEKVQGAKASYYLKRSDQTKDKTDEGFQFEDGEIVAGEEGKLIKKLSPFGGNHIVAKQELLQEVTTDNAQVNEQAFSQRLQETRGALLHKGFRLAELPNLKEPDNVGYYVEAYRAPVRITLLGDTVRYKDKENQDKQIRLSEKQYQLLWAIATGEPKLDADLVNVVSDVSSQDEAFFFGNLELLKTVAGSLNQNLSELTGVGDMVVPVGNEDFGYWHKVKDANISRRGMYLPLRSTRQDALKLIFQEDPATSKQDVINTLGQTSGRRQRPHPLNEQQAWVALRRAIYSLKYRNIENITTEDEAALYQEMQEYMGSHDLADERGLIDHIANRLGFPRRVSTSESVADVIDVTGADSAGDNEEIDVDDMDEIEEEIQDEGDSGVATLPRMTREGGIEAPEFGNLSKVDVALIAERLEFHRDRLEPFLGERGVRLIEQSALVEIADLVEGQEIGLEQQYLDGLMSANDFSNLMNEYRARAFEKAKEMLKDPNFGETVDRIGDQNPNVWGLLVNLSEINGVIERSGHVEGIAIIGKDPESLGAILSEVPAAFATNEATPTSPPQSTTVFETPQGVVGPVAGIEPIEPKASALERRDPEIRNILSQYMGSILEREGYNKPVSPAWVTRFAARIKERDMEHAVREGWVSPTSGSNGKHDLRYDAAAIATLLYLDDNSNQLNSRLKKQVQEIAEEEYRKRLKEKENNK